MFQAVIDLNGTGGSLLLAAYVLGGLAMFGAAFLPGNTTLYRFVCAILGLIMAFWALKVLLVGGKIFISVFVLVLPVVLIMRGVTATMRWVASRRPAASEVLPKYLPPPTQHPATRQFTGLTEPGYHPNPHPHAVPQEFGPQEFGPQEFGPQEFGAQEFGAQMAQRRYVPQPHLQPQGYATVHHQYSAVPRQLTATPQFVASAQPAPQDGTAPHRGTGSQQRTAQHGTVSQPGVGNRMPVVSVPATAEVAPRMPRTQTTDPAPSTPGLVQARHRAADASV